MTMATLSASTVGRTVGLTAGRRAGRSHPGDGWRPRLCRPDYGMSATEVADMLADQGRSEWATVRGRWRVRPVAPSSGRRLP